MQRFLITMTITLSLAASALAERQIVDRVIAIVDDEVIFMSDVEEVVRQYMFAQQKTQMTEADRRELEEKVLKDLINDKLVVAQAARLDIDIPFSEVEEKVNQSVEENMNYLGGKEAFERQLAREGFTVESLKSLYRKQVKNRLLVERVLQIEMARDRREPGDEELSVFYRDHMEDIPQRPAVVHLQTIFLDFGSSTSASSEARRRIDEVYEQATSGQPFQDLAEEFSEDPSAPNGGDLGFVNPDDLGEPAFREAVKQLGIGEISEPVLTTYGWHIIQVSERNPDNGEVRVRHILVRVQPSDGDIEEVFETANAIHRDLVAGAAFDSLANRYSTDKSAGPGGDLGWLKVAELPEFFRDVLAGMSDGDISQVLRESSGFRIVKLLGREGARPYDYEEVRGDLKRLWRQEQMAVAYEEYIETLRKKFTVDLKI
ncbi:MAG: peptidylprolyl isomerase [Candidatus Krumholzibacteriota bacterium]|nr:peptidylprolyl isomerase [Candidatus Krumholzibacteriota bacterium]